MATPAFSAQVKVSGTAVGMTAEACGLVSGTTYQVTNAAKRILDPSVAITVNDAGVPIPAANVTIDALFGRFTLSAPPGGAVTVDASYLPTATVADTKGVELNVTVDMGDATTFDSGGAKKKQPLLLDVAGSLMRLVLPLDDLDPVTGGSQTIDGWMKAGTPRLLDVLFTSGFRTRAWVLFKGYKVSGAVDGMVECTVDFEGAANNGHAFGIGT